MRSPILLFPAKLAKRARLTSTMRLAFYHALGLRDHDGAPSKAGQPVSLPGVVPLDAVGLVLARIALPHRQHIIDGIVIRAVEPGAPALQPLDQALACGLVTTAALPVHQLP